MHTRFDVIHRKGSYRKTHCATHCLARVGPGPSKPDGGKGERIFSPLVLNDFPPFLGPGFLNF